MLKKALIMGIALISLTACSLQKNIDNNTTTLEDSNQIILYYGETCPHCKIVEQYILENKVDSKLKITQKVVINNISDIYNFFIINS